MTCACYMSARTAAVSSRRWYWTTFLWLGVVGVGTGLAGSAKLNGLAALGAGILLVVAIAIRLRRSAAHKCLFAGCGVLVIAVSTSFTFVAMNPYLWPDVDRRVGNMFRHRLQEMKVITTRDKETRRPSVGERVTRASDAVFRECAAMKGNGTFFLNILLTATGMCLVIARARRWLLNRDQEPGPIVILLVGVMTAGPPLLLTLMDWDRYYLLPIFFSTLLISVAIAWYVKLFCRLPDALYRRRSAQGPGR